MRLYHSTSKQFLGAIMRDGLKPHAGGVGLNTHNVGVYLWRHPEQATLWAFGHHKRDGIVLTVELGRWASPYLTTDEEFFEDESEAYVFHGTIPTEAIRFDLTQTVAWRRMALEKKQRAVFYRTMAANAGA